MSVMLAVAERQIGQDGIADLFADYKGPSEWKLAQMLACLFGEDGATAHLDHDPPLRVRAYDPAVKDIAARYAPNANDPRYLVWRTKHDHNIKTNVRGEHGQFPDRVLIKRERRRERKAEGRTKRKSRLRSASRWPTGRKIPSRPFAKRPK